MAYGTDPPSGTTTNLRSSSATSNLAAFAVVVTVAPLAWLLDATAAAPPIAVLLGAVIGAPGEAPIVPRGIAGVLGVAIVWTTEPLWAGAVGTSPRGVAATLGLLLVLGLLLRQSTHGAVPSWIVAVGGAAALGTAAGAGEFGMIQALSTSAGVLGGLLSATIVQGMLARRQHKRASRRSDHPAHS